jgi:hypothetical protein
MPLRQRRVENMDISSKKHHGTLESGQKAEPKFLL